MSSRRAHTWNLWFLLNRNNINTKMIICQRYLLQFISGLFYKTNPFLNQFFWAQYYASVGKAKGNWTDRRQFLQTHASSNWPHLQSHKSRYLTVWTVHLALMKPLKPWHSIGQAKRAKSCQWCWKSTAVATVTLMQHHSSWKYLQAWLWLSHWPG